MIFRDINFLKQLKFSFLYKGLAIGISFLLTRYMLQYLGVSQYGIWSVILTFINWVIFFDFGIANGVKNKVSECLSSNNFVEAKEYISTGYIILFTFFIGTFIFFSIGSFFVNWQIVFNVMDLDNSYLQNVMLVTLFFVLLNFVLSIIIAIFNATQNASLIVLQQLISQSIALFFVLLLNSYSHDSLLYMSFAYGLALCLSTVLLSLYFYKKNSILRPSFKFYKKNKIKSIFSLGMKFFYLQLTILIILSSDTMIITQLLGSSYVTSYDILFKYFGLLMIIHSIINTPLWSMYTEAYSKNDYEWVEKTLRRMAFMMLIYIIIAIVMYVFGTDIIYLWLGDIDLKLVPSNYIYMIIMTLSLIWYSIFAYFTNGIDQTRIQLMAASVGAIINIPLSIYFVKYLEMGINGVLLATIISLLIFGILGPIQAIKEIRKMKELNCDKK